MLESPRKYIGGLCPDCKSNYKIYRRDEGMIICGDCGLVLRERIMDKEPSWSSTMNYPLNNNGSSTIIGSVRGNVRHDYRRRKLPQKRQSQMLRLKKWQTQVNNEHYRKNLSQAMKEIWRLRDVLHIPLYVIETAGAIYRKALDKDLIRGRSIIRIADAALYASCRFHGIPRSLKDIADNSSYDEKSIGVYYKLLLKKLDDIVIPPPNPKNYFSRIGSKIGINGETEGKAARILRLLKKRKIHVHRDPQVVTATAYNWACMIERNNGGEVDKELTQKEIAKRSGVSFNAMRLTSNIIFETVEPSELAKEVNVDEKIVQSIFIKHEKHSKSVKDSWTKRKNSNSIN